MDRRIAFLPGSVAAALASVAVTLLFALYLPLNALICPPFARNAPDVLQGQAFFDKPSTTLVAINIHADGRLPDSMIFRALAAAREAGYTEAYAFGRGRRARVQPVPA
jgi:hypothetical protein